MRFPIGSNKKGDVHDLVVHIALDVHGNHYTFF